MSKKLKLRILASALSVCILATALYSSIIVLADSQSYSGGSGTETDPFLISSNGDLALLDADTVAGNTQGKYYKLTADLTVENLSIGQNRSDSDFKETSKGGSLANVDEYLPNAKPFEGVFDGDYHTITYTYNAKHALGGMFSGLKNATVKNLTVKGTATDPRINFGSIAAFAFNSLIDNCISEVDVVDGGMWSAGIVGVAYNSTIRNTENRGDITQSGRWPGKNLYQNLQKQFNETYKVTDASFTGLYNYNLCPVAGIAAMVAGDMEFTNVLNSGNVTSKYMAQYTITAGVVAYVNNKADTGHTVTFNSVGNTGDIKSNRVGNDNDRIGGIYGIIEHTNFTLNKIWSTGTITPAKDASGNFNRSQTGVVAGGFGGTCKRVGNIIAYGVQGKIDGFTQTDKKVRSEFFGRQDNFGDATTCSIYYDGDAYVPEDTDATFAKLDLKSAAFAEQLGDCWQANAGDYPSINHRQYGGGEGTEANPYIIASDEHLAQLDVNTVLGLTKNKYYKLTADLTVENLSIGQNRSDSDFKETSKGGSLANVDEYLPNAKPFEGVFDGDYHTITYTYNAKHALGGMFSGLKNATVKNLTVKGTATDPRINFGSIAAFAFNSLIDNCISEVDVVDGGMWSAGIVGVAYNSTIRNTENRGDITQSGRWPGKNLYQNLQKQFNETYKVTDASFTGLYNYNLCPVAGIAAMVAGDMEFTNVLNSGNVTSKYMAQYTITAGVVAYVNNKADTGHTVTFNSVGNTGDIKSNRVGNDNDRIGGIYGIIEHTNFTLNKIWSTGTITPAKDASGNFNRSQTGVVAGGFGGTCNRVGNIIAYGVQGKIDGFTQTDKNVRSEFFGRQDNFGDATTCSIYYDGDAYVPVNTDVTLAKLDLKSAAFAEQLGSDWCAVDNGYPMLKTTAKIKSLTVDRPGTDRKVDLSPSFDANVYEYTGKVLYESDKVILNVGTATGTVSGDVGEKSLVVGKNNFTITVTAADGAKRDYHFTITRTNENVSTDATLKSLTVSGAQLNETFSKEKTDYTVNAVWKLKKVTITAEVSDSKSVVIGAGEKDLEIGLNTFEIKVIAENDSEKIYTLRITRDPLFKAGNGTKDDPYLIRNEEDLRNLALSSNESIGNKFVNVYFKQTADIDLRGEQWTPICSSKSNIFAGHYDGNGFIIKNLKIDANDDNKSMFETATDVTALGLFGYIGAGETYTSSVKNVTVEVSIINNLSSPSVAGIVGCIDHTYKATNDTIPLIENCVVKGSIASRKGNAGGILGSADNSSVKLIDCTNYATITVPTDGYTPKKDETLRYAGGIGGGIWVNNQLTIVRGCINYGDITGYTYVGGILGRLSQSVSGTANNGIDAANGYETIIENCGNYGNVTLGTHNIDEKGNIGGIIGAITDGAGKVTHMTKVKLNNLYNVGTLTAMNYYDSKIGALVGVYNLIGEIENCYNAGKIVVNDDRALTAGVIGVLADRGEGNMATMKNCYYWAQEGIDLEGVPVGFNGDAKGVVEQLTWMQISNGELAYLLDNGDSANRTYNWTQDTVKGFPVIGNGEQTAVYKTSNGYTIGENGTLIVGTDAPYDDDSGNDNDTPETDNNTDTKYPVVIDAGVLDAKLDLVNHRLVLPNDNVAIWELNNAMTLTDVTVAYYNADGSEITNDEIIMTEGMVMKVFNTGGNLLDTFTVVYSSSIPSTGEDISGINIVLAVFAVSVVLVCVFYCKKKKMYN